jgi:hypothetical protein
VNGKAGFNLTRNRLSKLQMDPKAQALEQAYVTEAHERPWKALYSRPGRNILPLKMSN